MAEWRLYRAMVLEQCRLLEDDRVVEAVRGGDTGLYELLMRRYNQRVYRVIRSVLIDDAEAEDVLQETWVRAYERLDQFKGLASFPTWVTKIALYEAMARARKSRRWRALENAEGGIRHDAEQQTAVETPEAEAMRLQLGTILQDAVDWLPEAYRAVFMLREIERLSTAETAECLGLSEEAVKTRLHRSRAMLRRRVEAVAGPAIIETYRFLGGQCDRTVERVLERIG